MPKKKRPRELSVMLWCRAAPSLVKRVDQIAEDSERPRSWVIRQLLIRALEAQEKTA